jgi:hypothetical protein
MDAHWARCAVLAAAWASLGASYRTDNFVVEAPTAEMAQQIGRAAEKYRRELAIEWLGKEMPNWSQPCPVTAQVADHLGAGGATSFVFEHGEVFGWRMTIQGSFVRILDSVLPHEVTHTVFATHFRQPLPRWADEGACTTVEHSSEREKQQTMLVDFLRTGRGIAFSRMFVMKDYPHDVMPLYSQGYSVARYLVAQGGKRKFLDYLGDGLRDENWTRATQQHYGIDSLAALQNNWLTWVRKGSPALDVAGDVPALVAVKTSAASSRPGRPETNLIHRESTPDARQPDAGAVASSDGKTRSVYELVSASKGSRGPGPSDLSEPDGAWHAPRRSAASAMTVAADEEQVGPVDDTDHQPQPPAQHQVTRPQPVQRSRQVILEWSRPPGTDAGAVAGVSGHYSTPSAN